MMNLKRLIIPAIFLLSLLLFGCPPSSPMQMQFRISPQPIVGREVFGIIRLRSRIEAPSTKLKLDASEGIIFPSEVTNIDVHLPEGEWVEVRIPFIVNRAGVYVISAHALSNFPDSVSVFGAGETLYIRSGTIGAIVSKNEISE
jgi:hypothetical protein